MKKILTKLKEFIEKYKTKFNWLSSKKFAGLVSLLALIASICLPIYLNYKSEIDTREQLNLERERIKLLESQLDIQQQEYKRLEKRQRIEDIKNTARDLFSHLKFDESCECYKQLQQLAGDREGYVKFLNKAEILIANANANANANEKKDNTSINYFLTKAREIEDTDEVRKLLEKWGNK